MNWPMKVVPAVWVVLFGLFWLRADSVIRSTGPCSRASLASRTPPGLPSSSPDYSSTRKLAKEGTLGLRMILRPVISQEHRDPKTSASGFPGTVQIGLMVALRHTSSWQPLGAYN